jgi:HAD superfamily hydrolase (TIGR01509 family)
MNNMMSAVIFDMDGVLIDSEPLHYQTDLELLKELNINVEKKYLDKFVGMTNPELWKIICQEFKIESKIEDILAKQIKLKIKLLNADGYTPIPGVIELINKIYDKNIPIGVASSSSLIFIEAVLIKTNLKKYIKKYISGESVPNGKPEPDIFIKIAEVLNVDPEKCVVIEDSKNGVLAAKTAGMKCIGFLNPNSGNQDLSKADKIIDSFDDLSVQIIAELSI